MDESQAVCAAESRTLREVIAEQSGSARVELVQRPWGSFESIERAEGYQVKRLTVAPGGKLSLQLHYRRSEHWVIVSGVGRVTRGAHVFELQKNESVFIPAGLKHRLENPFAGLLQVIEVQVGDYLGEDDIVRFEDAYRRA
ncbi:MAG: phosphomannose isomerase type II C-terminal cupin domain [Candidatus Parcubacteria bacterium]|nr:phosphomannose isomerase type II C-terminal cupin domain [Burkholderiales bacterium]